MARKSSSMANITLDNHTGQKENKLVNRIEFMPVSSTELLLIHQSVKIQEIPLQLSKMSAITEKKPIIPIQIIKADKKNIICHDPRATKSNNFFLAQHHQWKVLYLGLLHENLYLIWSKRQEGCKCWKLPISLFFSPLSKILLHQHVKASQRKMTREEMKR